MNYRFFILLYMFTAVVLSLEAQTKGTTGAKAPADVIPAAEQPPAMSVPKVYRYDPRGRRDPFADPIPRPVTGTAPAIPVVRPPGLSGVLLDEAVVAGVVTSREPSMNVAVIKAPGGRTYFARTGDALLDAVIKEIRPDGVIFSAPAPGVPTIAPSREIERKVRPAPGEE